jgi:hypothetical protein
MRFAAVGRAYLRSPPACFASASALGTWMRIYSYAAEIERGGLIPGCAGYGDREWQSLIQATKSEVDEAVTAGLCEWRDGDLTVLGYDTTAESKVQTARENGRSGGRPPKKPTGNPSDNPSDNPTITQPITQPEPPILSDLIRSYPDPDLCVSARSRDPSATSHVGRQEARPTGGSGAQSPTGAALTEIYGRCHAQLWPPTPPNRIWRGSVGTRELAADLAANIPTNAIADIEPTMGQLLQKAHDRTHPDATVIAEAPSAGFTIWAAEFLRISARHKSVPAAPAPGSNTNEKNLTKKQLDQNTEAKIRELRARVMATETS